MFVTFLFFAGALAITMAEYDKDHPDASAKASVLISDPKEPVTIGNNTWLPIKVFIPNDQPSALRTGGDLYLEKSKPPQSEVLQALANFETAHLELEVLSYQLDLLKHSDGSTDIKGAWLHHRPRSPK